MGANVSATKNTVNEESINKTINKYMQTSSNTVKNTLGSNQINQLEIGDGAVIGCNIKLANKTQISAIATGTMESSSVTNLQNDLKSQLSSDFSKTAEQTAGLSFGAANVDSTINDINMAVNNTIENTVTQKSIQDIMNTVYTVQDNKMVIGKNMTCLPGANITLDNDTVVSAFATAMTKSIMDATAKNTTLTEISSKFKEKVKQTTSIFAGLGGLILAIVLIGAFTRFRPTNCFKQCKGTNASLLESCMESCKKTSFSKSASSKRTQIIIGVILLSLLILLGVGIWLYIKALNKKAPTKKGTACFVSSTEVKDGVLTYAYNSDGVCTSKTCNQLLGYDLNSDGDACVLKSGWTKPLPDGSECRTSRSDSSVSNTIHFCTDSDRKAAPDSDPMKNNNICKSDSNTTCPNCKDDKTKDFCGYGNCRAVCS